jgi:hypothetical protein
MELSAVKEKPTRIKFIRAEKPLESALVPALVDRSTNRKSYNVDALSSSDMSCLKSAAENDNGVVISFTEHREDITRLAVALSTYEKIIFSNKKLHECFFDEVVWDREEEIKRASGLYIPTLELEKPQIIVLRLIKKWWMAKTLNAIGLNGKIARENAHVYASCATMGALSVPDSDESFISLGRIMERVWLTAHVLGLSFQVFAGITFLYPTSRENKTLLSRAHALSVRSAYEQICEIFGKPAGVVALVLRVGRSDPPSTYSTKRHYTLRECVAQG